MHSYDFVAFLGRYNDDPMTCDFFKILPKLPQPAAVGPWIAGGALRRTLLGEGLTSDIDFFFRNAEQAATFHDDMLALKGWEIRRTGQNVTYGIHVDNAKIIVQAITIGYYLTPEAVIDSFDFTITQFAFDGTLLYCGEHSLWDLARKRLALHRLTFGTSTVRRLIKYTRQGFTACSGCLADILESAVADPQTIQREVEYVD